MLSACEVPSAGCFLHPRWAAPAKPWKAVLSVQAGCLLGMHAELASLVTALPPTHISAFATVVASAP